MDDDSEVIDEQRLSKPEIAKMIQRAVPGAFLSGGAAVALMGGPRKIKDLDFRIDVPFTFREEDEVGQEFINDLNAKLNRVFNRDVADFEVSDASTGYTIAGKCADCDVSFTRTPRVRYQTLEKRHGVKTLSPPDLVWDKAYSLVFRFVKGEEAEDKEFSDLSDLVFLLAQDHEDGKINVQLLDQLPQKRGAAYRKQGRNVYRREHRTGGKVEKGWTSVGESAPLPNLLAEFAALIIEINEDRFEDFCGDDFDARTFETLKNYANHRSHPTGYSNLKPGTPLSVVSSGGRDSVEVESFLQPPPPIRRDPNPFALLNSLEE